MLKVSEFLRTQNSLKNEIFEPILDNTLKMVTSWLFCIILRRLILSHFEIKSSKEHLEIIFSSRIFLFFSQCYV